MTISIEELMNAPTREELDVRKNPNLNNEMDNLRDYSTAQAILYLAMHPIQAIKTVRALYYVLHGGPL